MQRRDFVQSASLGTLSWFCAQRLLRADDKPKLPGKGNAKGSKPAHKSLIMLWMDGAPSQLETFDPHPGTVVGGPTKAIDTSLKGVQFASELPRLATHAHEMTIVRSMSTKEGDHERARYLMKTGFRPIPSVIHPTLGAISAYAGRGDGAALPNYITINSEDRLARGGYLGEAFDPFKIGDPSSELENITGHKDADRQKRRLDNLQAVEGAFASSAKRLEDRTVHRNQIERALSMMSSSDLAAFRVADEPASVRDRYGHTTFGRGCLAARKLIETGVRCVEVTLGGWDLHADNFRGCTLRNGFVDQAFSALIEDLKQRDLLDSTLVLWTGEFGRTPKINGLDGRDHHNEGFSSVLVGGGFQKGLCVGATDPNGSKPPTNPMTVDDLYATVLHSLGINPAQEHEAILGRPIKLSDGKIRKELLV